MNKSLYIIILLATILVGLQSCQKTTGDETHVGVGEAMPVFLTYDNLGRNVDNSSLKGKLSVIVFFDTRCNDCRMEFGDIEMIYKYIGENVNVLAIAREQEASAVRQYWNEMGYTMPFAAPGNRTVYNLFDRGSGSGIPQVYIADKDGVVVGYYDQFNLLTYETFVSEYQQYI